jgi:hypothetical protein
MRLIVLRPTGGRTNWGGLVPRMVTGVGFVVEIVFVVDVVQRIRQIVLQFIAFDLIGEI